MYTKDEIFNSVTGHNLPHSELGPEGFAKMALLSNFSEWNRWMRICTGDEYQSWKDYFCTRVNDGVGYNFDDFLTEFNTMIRRYIQANQTVSDSISLNADGAIDGFSTLAGADAAKYLYLCFRRTLPANLCRQLMQYAIVSPIILDLDGDGVETLGLNESSTMFDFDGSGFKYKSGWVGADDGFLVFDRNGDGIINNGGELFGNNTLRYEGSGNCRDGYEALAQEDTNGDGILNYMDVNWSSLKVWRDLNQDGITDEGELFTLEELGITGINVGYNMGNEELPNGNMLQGQGTYFTDDGTRHSLSDAWFALDMMDVLEELNQLPGLPSVVGGGLVGTLLHSCTKSDSLMAIVRQISAENTREAQLSQVDDLLYEWARTSGLITTVDERAAAAGNPVVNHNNKPRQVGVAWDRMLHVVEAFAGGYLVEIPDHKVQCVSIHWDAGFISSVNSYYEYLRQSVASAIAVQTRFDYLLDLIKFGVNEDKSISLDISNLNDYFVDSLVADRAAGLIELMDFNQSASTLLDCFPGWSGQSLIYDLILHTEMTPELKAAYEEYKLHVAGTSRYNPLGSSSDDVIFGTGGVDTVKGGAGDDIIYGGAGNDRLYGDNGDDLLYGGMGDDILDGGQGDDILDGGVGNDCLIGGVGNDTFVFGKGYGHDTVDANDSGIGKHDKILLMGLKPDEIEFGVINRFGSSGGVTNYDFMIRIKETGETITVYNGLYSERYGIQSVEFGDGSVLNWNEIKQMDFQGTDGDDKLYLYQGSSLHGRAGNDQLYGSSYADALYGGDGNDKLYGGHGDDILDGGAGNDHLEGGTGNDTFVFGKGYGHDTVDASDNTAGKHDKILLKGLKLDEIEFGVINRFGSSGGVTNYDFLIRIKETGETIAVYNGLHSDRYGIQSVEFDDGMVLSWNEIRQMGLYGTSTDDKIYLNQNGFLYGGEGNDMLYGSTGNDVLFGESGDDKLYGKDGDDILDGGAGNDYLEGGSGNDIYTFRAGDGQDTINNYDNTIGDDLLKLEGIEVCDLWFEKSGSHLVISLIGSQDKLTVNSWYSNDYYKIGTIEAEGSALAYNQVAQMVQAMAAIGAPGGAGGNWTDDQREALNPIIASYWQPRV